jgi:rhodanese-related sulfurtransferase
MVAWWSPFGQVPQISAVELHDRLAHGVKIQLLDVRTRWEFAHGHIAGAVNVPIQSLRGELPHLELDGSKPVVAICKTAHRSPAATRALRAYGFDAVQLAKGMDDWRRQKLPVRRV